MSLESDVARIALKLDKISEHMLPAIGLAVHQSIQEGSPITGAPGQPVGQYGPGYNEGSVGGTLKGSWQVTFPSPEIAEITTNLVYAKPIEDGVGKYGPLRLRSSVGGFHSVALTRINFPRLVDHVLNADIRPAGFQDNSALGAR